MSNKCELREHLWAKPTGRKALLKLDGLRRKLVQGQRRELDRQLVKKAQS